LQRASRCLTSNHRKNHLKSAEIGANLYSSDQVLSVLISGNAFLSDAL